MRWIGVLGLLGGSGGCGGGDDGDDGGPGFPRACDESAVDGDCLLFSGSDWTSADVTGECTGDLLPSCPPTGVVGTCTIDPGDPFETVTTFYSPRWTAAQGVQACQSSGGTWVEAR